MTCAMTSLPEYMVGALQMGESAGEHEFRARAVQVGDTPGSRFSLLIIGGYKTFPYAQRDSSGLDL